MLFRILGRLYFYTVLVPYFFRILRPVINDLLLKHGAEYMTPKTLDTLQREHDRRWSKPSSAKEN